MNTREFDDHRAKIFVQQFLKKDFCKFEAFRLEAIVSLIQQSKKDEQIELYHRLHVCFRNSEMFDTKGRLLPD